MDNILEHPFSIHLQDTVLSTDDPEWGSKYRRKHVALRKRYVALNRFYRQYIALDIDKPASAYLWEEVKLPPPTHVVVNPVNTRCHYLYRLKTPVIYTEAGRRRPQRFFEHVDKGLTELLGADPGYAGLLVKNPFHSSWRSIFHNCQYDLEDFSEWVDLTVSRETSQSSTQVTPDLVGRNCTLFENLRQWAYKAIHNHVNGYESWQLAVDQQALNLNQHFNPALPAKEVLSTSKSVGKWTWRHRHTIGQPKNTLGLPDNLTLNDKQVFAALNTNEQRRLNSIELIQRTHDQLILEGGKITQKRVSERSSLGLRTVERYWKLIQK